MKWGTNTWVGGSLVGLALGVAIFAPWIALTDPVMAANLMNAELPPSWEFPFGTDAQGRDIYSRICYGARISLTVGIVSQICNSLIGVTSLSSGTVSLIDPSFREQTAIKVGAQPMDMAFHGDELFVACQGDGSVHVIDIPNRRHKQSFRAGTGCESLAFF